jgi:hypothetical protein
LLFVIGLFVVDLFLRCFSYDKGDQRADKIQYRKQDERSDEISSLSDEDEGDRNVYEENEIVKEMCACKGHLAVGKDHV